MVFEKNYHSLRVVEWIGVEWKTKGLAKKGVEGSILNNNIIVRKIVTSNRTKLVIFHLK